MPKYLFQANYTSEGMQGLLKEGGISRRQVFEEMAKEQAVPWNPSITPLVGQTCM